MARVLVACEFSGIVRDAFRARGHDAISCDFLPTERPGPHYVGDVLALLGEPWDLVIAHPPCTYLTVSGNKWMAPQYASRFPGRAEQREQAVEFFLSFFRAGVPRLAVENPVGIMSTRFKKPDQVLQPWMFGHPEQKATCLWLVGLPRLVPTNDVRAAMLAMPEAERQRLHWLPPGPARARERSRTFQGIADAMAAQWGPLLPGDTPCA